MGDTLLAGKGAFVTGRSVDWDPWPACGLEWAALQHSWCWGDQRGALASSEVTRSVDELVLESARARARGVHPWWWAWVVPSRVEAWVEQVAADLRAAGEAAPVGLVLNLELAEPKGGRGSGRPAWTTGSGEAAKLLLDGVRTAWPGEVWVTTHGIRVARQPWEYLGLLDGVMPQAYNASCSYDGGFVSRCLASYAGDFPDPSHRAPLLGANSTPAPCMRRYATESAEAGSAAVGWWAWTGLAASPAKRAVVRELQVARPAIV